MASHAVAHSSASDPSIPPRPRTRSRSSLRPSSSSSTLSSVLTEDRLREHSRRSSATLPAASPYYKGLTDSGLYLRSLALSPGRESLHSSGTSASSVRTFFVKIQSWSTSCFAKRKHGDAEPAIVPALEKLPTYPRGDGWDPGLSPRGGGRRPVARPEGKPLRERKPAPAAEGEPLRERKPAPAAEGEPLRERKPVPAGEGEPLRERKPVPAGEGEPLRERKPVPAGEGEPLRERKPELAVPAPAAVAVARPIMPVVAADDVRRRVVSGERTRGTNVEKEKYVWAHKYRPRLLKEFICNRDRAEELLQMVIKEQCNHYIFEGPPGVGKKTMVLALLRDAFGPEKIKMKNELKKIELKGELVTSIDINVRISSQHVEVNLSESCGYEKHVIVALINESIASLDKTRECDHTNCRVIVLHEAERLSTDAQHYVCWLMEKYKGCNRVVFCCSDSSKLHPLKNLCKIVKLWPPSDIEIIKVLEFIAKKEHIELPHGLAKRIAEKSKHNLRQAIRSFEASWKLKYPFEENQEIVTGWEEDIANIAKNIVEEQSPKQLYIIRGKLKNLIEHNVSPNFIFSSLVAELKKHLDDEIQPKVDALYQEYNIRNNGFSLNKEKQTFSYGEEEDSDGNFHDQKNVHYFMRIEEFTAKFMSYYKSFLNKIDGVTDCCAR